MTSDYIQQLAHFAAGLRLADVLVRVLERARGGGVLPDTCGVILGGRTHREVDSFAKRANANGDVHTRALADGTAAVSQELDNGCAEARGHPDAHVVPAPLAVAAEQNASDAALLLAVIAGYENAARMGAAMCLREGLHLHRTWGMPSGAVAVGLLIGLDERELAPAIGATLSLAPDYQAVFEVTTSRSLWAGTGNLASVIAVRAAFTGFTGPGDAPSNTYGRGIGVSFDAAVAGGGLGDGRYLDRNCLKRYACCGHTHAAIDAFRTVVDALAASPQDIERIDVHTASGPCRRRVDWMCRNRRSPPSSRSHTRSPRTCTTKASRTRCSIVPSLAIRYYWRRWRRCAWPKIQPCPPCFPQSAARASR